MIKSYISYYIQFTLVVHHIMVKSLYKNLIRINLNLNIYK